MRIHKDSPLPATQSGLGSQIAPPQARNNASGCNAAPFLHHNTGFEVGTADARSDRCVHPFSDDPMRCIRRTTIDCLGCRSSLLECRFGRSGSSEFVVSFRRLRWSSCVPVRTAHALRQDWIFHAGYVLLITLI